MITIPIWVFVLLIILASCTAISILLIIVAFISYIIFDRNTEFYEEENNCPEFVEPADKTDNPEYIPPEERK